MDAVGGGVTYIIVVAVIVFVAILIIKSRRH
jgi:hypothetical protein